MSRRIKDGSLGGEDCLKLFVVVGERLSSGKKTIGGNQHGYQ